MNIENKSVLFMGVLAGVALSSKINLLDRVLGVVLHHALVAAYVSIIIAGWYLFLLRNFESLRVCGWLLGVVAYFLSAVTFILCVVIVFSASGNASLAWLFGFVIFFSLFPYGFYFLGLGALAGWVAQKFILESEVRSSGSVTSAHTMKLIVILFVVFAILTISTSNLVDIRNDPKNRVVGVTEGFKEIPCAKPRPGAYCSAPDERKIAFYMRVDDRSIAIPPPERDVDSKILMGLFVSDDVVETIYDNRKKGNTSLNYLIGSFINTVNISYAREEPLVVALRWQNIGRTANYSEVSSDLAGYRKYDDATCPAVGAHVDKQSLSESERYVCTSSRRALYIHRERIGSLVSCMHTTHPDDILRLHSCSITTKINMGGQVQYSISPEHFVSGKWLDLDARIVNYLNGIMVPGDDGA